MTTITVFSNAVPKLCAARRSQQLEETVQTFPAAIRPSSEYCLQEQLKKVNRGGNQEMIGDQRRGTLS
jgi:hypothetical protein